MFYAIIFMLFRIFEIIKPFPVSYFDNKFKNSFGVIFDDICAGLYVVLIIIIYMLFK
jgi:phosphatidylglycerophosphatase A